MCSSRLRLSAILACGMFCTLFIAPPASAEDAAIQVGTTATQEVNLAQYADLSNPTTVAFEVSALTAGGPPTAQAIIQAASGHLAPAGYRLVDLGTNHRVEVQVTLQGDPQVSQVPVQSTRSAAMSGFLARFGAGTSVEMAMRYTMYALVSISIDGQPTVQMDTVAAVVQGANLQHDEAKARLEVLIGEKLAAFLTGSL